MGYSALHLHIFNVSFSLFDNTFNNLEGNKKPKVDITVRFNAADDRCYNLRINQLYILKLLRNFFLTQDLYGDKIIKIKYNCFSVLFFNIQGEVR